MMKEGVTSAGFFPAGWRRCWSAAGAEKWVHLLGTCCCPWLITTSTSYDKAANGMPPTSRRPHADDEDVNKKTKIGSLLGWTRPDPNDPDLELSILQPEDVHQVSEFLLANFFAQEPLGQCLGLDPDLEVRPWLAQVLQHQIREGLSVAIRSKTSGEMAAVCVSDVIHRDPEPDDVTVFSYVEEEKQPGMWKIGRLLDSLMEGVDLFDGGRQPDVVVLQMLAVGSSYGGRGLAGKLIEATEEVTRSNGHWAVVSEATSHYSAKAFARAGFRTVKRIEYADFTLGVGGEAALRPFQDLGGQRSVHSGAEFMMKQVL